MEYTKVVHFNQSITLKLVLKEELAKQTIYKMEDNFYKVKEFCRKVFEDLKKLPENTINVDYIAIEGEPDINNIYNLYLECSMPVTIEYETSDDGYGNPTNWYAEGYINENAINMIKPSLLTILQSDESYGDAIKDFSIELDDYIPDPDDETWHRCICDSFDDEFLDD